MIITVPKSGSRKISSVTTARAVKDGHKIFFNTGLSLYLLLRESQINIIRASLATSEGWKLKKNRLIHLVDSPITGETPGISTSANNPIEISKKITEIFE
jgi:hypothetical protein